MNWNLFKKETPTEAMQKGLQDAEKTTDRLKATAAFNFAVQSGLLAGLKALEALSQKSGGKLRVREVHVINADYFQIELENLPSVTDRECELAHGADKPKSESTTTIVISKTRGLLSDCFKVETAMNKVAHGMVSWGDSYWVPVTLTEKNACTKTLRYVAKRAREEGLVP